MDPTVEESDEDVVSSSSSEDEDPQEWTEETEKSFLKTLCYLKKKDPKIYDDKVSFFTDTVSDASKIKEKPKDVDDSLYLRDYERKIIIDKGGVLTDEETDDEDILKKRSSSPTYVEEQRRLKDGFKKMLCNDDDDADDCNSYVDSTSTANNDKCAGFLKIKTKTSQEKEKEEADYIEWLKGKKQDLDNKEIENDLKYLRDYWSDPNLADGEQFLRDYILNKRYLETDENIDDVSELEFSEEEEMLNKHDQYENEYNFRFEEPDKEFIKTYPRVIDDSLRRKSEKRKKKRELAKEKKQKLLKNKTLELKRMKKIKKQELLTKIEKIKEATGNSRLGFQDIGGDFNPDEYDKKMSELFNEEFYDVEDDTKPVFSDSDHYDDDNDDSCNDADTASGFELEEDKMNMNAQSLYENINDIDNMDCDYDPNVATESKFKRQTRSSRKKGHKKSKLMEAVGKKKPVFNPADKTFQQYVDEYYGMEFEDVIAGDIPCRFKYRKVVPNNFGLTIEEILAADDKELNKWCSMAKIDTIRNEQSEKFDLKAYFRKGNNLDLKKKILPSLFKEQEESENHTSSSINVKVNNNEENQKSASNKRYNQHTFVTDNKKLKENRKSASNKCYNRRTFGTDSKKLEENQKSASNKRYKQRAFGNDNKKFKKDNITADTNNISDERLKAYGLNPKKYKNKIKYAPKN